MFVAAGEGGWPWLPGFVIGLMGTFLIIHRLKKKPTVTELCLALACGMWGETTTCSVTGNCKPVPRRHSTDSER